MIAIRIFLLLIFAVWQSYANGNTRTNGANTFSYDAENRLTNYNAAATFVYNGDGLRVRKTVGGTTTFYLVDDRNPTGYAQVMEEATVSGGVTNHAKVYTYGLDLIAQRDVSSGLRTFYGYDGNGNTRYLTTTNAAVSDTYAYDAFGTLLTSTGSTANNYLYAGEQYDSTLGLYYLRARYLNSATGRFWTRDSWAGALSDPGSLHKYLYVHSNPGNRSDPSGHFDIIQTQAVLGQIGVQAARYSPVIVVASRYASRILTGIQRVQTLAQTVVAEGGELIAYEQRVVNAAGQVIGRFRSDLIVQLPNRVTTLVESKGVPWYLYGSSGWGNYLAQLSRQASAFGQTVQSGGVQIQQRIIVFASRAPAGLQEAENELVTAIGNNYSRFLWGVQEFEQFFSVVPIAP